MLILGSQFWVELFRWWHELSFNRMDELETDLKIVTQQLPVPNGDTLAEALRRLDAVAVAHTLPAQLQHYLQRRSYLKALSFLENPELPHER